MDDQDLDRLLAQVRRIEEHREKGAEAEIRKAYQELMKELRHYLADAYTQYAEEDRLSYAILQKHGYYARFLEEVEQKINDISPEVKRTIRSTVDQTYEYTYNGMIDCVKKAAPDTTVTTGLKACTPDVIRRAVENPVSKLTLNDRLEKHRKEIIYDIKRDVSVGLMNGDRYSTMANRIRKSVDGDYKKAIRIARTETHRVREAGNHDAAQAVDEVLKSGESGMQMVKTWRTKKDERVRPAKAKGKNRQYNHKKMDGVAIPVDEEFTLPSGAKTVAPGQSGVAGEDINCRCWLSYGLKKIPEDVMIKKRLTKQLEKLDDEEKAALTEYTGFGAQQVNNAIETGRISSKVQAKIDVLDRALAKGVITDDIVVTRKTIPEYMNAFPKGHKPTEREIFKLKGRRLSNNIFTSTALEPFDYTGRNVEIHIKVPKGYQGGLYIKGAAADRFKYQEEILFKRGFEYEISSIELKNGIYYMVAEAII